MKEVLSLCTFGIGALCFVLFIIVFKPDATSAVPAPAKSEICKREGSSGHGCRPLIYAS